MKIKPLDILFALKAINLTPGLKNNDRAVAATLLDHFNRKTEQCDPGLERIAKLLGISTRTVIRSLPRIEAAGLFVRKRHAGHSNRNSYEPNWQRCREIEAAWTVRMKVNSRSEPLTQVSPAPCQPCHVDSDRSVTQTCRSNLSKETCQKGLTRKEEARVVELRLSRKVTPNSRADAARTASERRWTNDLHEQFASLPRTYGEIIQAIDTVMQEAATEAEMRNRGAGLAHILNQLRIPR
jgi:predicted transcriptional regulator